MRLTPILVAVSMVIISASLSAILYLQAGLPLGESCWIGIAALLAMLLAQFFGTRGRETTGLVSRLDDIGGVSTKLTRELESLNLRIADLEVAIAHRLEDSIDERLSPVLGELGKIEERLGTIARNGLTVTATSGAPADGASEDTDGATQDDARKPVSEKAKRSPAFENTDDKAMLAMIREAVEAGRIDIHLQPVVTLPQRKVRYYEALARLRTADGETMTPDDFLTFAQEAKLVPAIDFTVLVRAVQVVRKLTSRNREVGIFLNVGLSTLQDERFASQYLEFAGHNTALAGSIVFEMTQADFAAVGPIEQGSLDALTEHGFRLSVDAVERLSIDGKQLSEKRVRFVKADAQLLLQTDGGLGSDIHPADLSDLLARYGIDLIAMRIERESEVVDLIDYDVRFAQGNLFSPPRPVKADILKDDTGKKALEPAQ